MVCEHWEMYCVHGWFVLQLNAYGDSDDAKAAANVKQIRKQLDDLFLGANALADVRNSNGMWLLSLAGYQNRPRENARAIEALLERVGQLLPGSYGILYESDDERVEPPGRNAFRVRVMTRGTLTEHEDPFLSPIQWIIEDPEPPAP